MSYTVKDRFHKIVINLTTKIEKTSNFKLDVYKKNSNVVNHTYTPKVTKKDDGSKLLTFAVLNRHFSVGDILERFVVRFDGVHSLYELHEGVSILIDGEEANVEKVENGAIVKDKDGSPVLINPVTSNTFAYTFKDNEPHTIQAVYKGNNEIGFAASNQLTITPKQYSDDGTTPVVDAHYKLVQDVPKTWKYLDTPNWTWTLTKGGVPVEGKTIERILFWHVWSGTTDANGQVKGDLGGVEAWQSWKIGKTQIGGQFYHYDEKDPTDKTVLTECWDTIEIVKNTPTLRFIPATKKGNTVQFQLLDPQRRGMSGKTVTMYVNSKAYVKTTDSIGKVYVRMNETGNFNYKATFAGNSYYEQVTAEGNETITD